MIKLIIVSIIMAQTAMASLDLSGFKEYKGTNCISNRLEWLAAIVSTPDINELDVSNCGLTSEDVAHFAGMELRILNISSNFIGGSKFIDENGLAKLPTTLTILHAINCELTDADITAICSLPSLQELHIEQNPIEEFGLRKIAEWRESISLK